MSWNLLVILLSGILLAVLVWSESKRQNTARLTLRILASIVLVASLAMVQLPLSYSSGMHQPTPSAAVLLTDGYDPDSLRTFLETSGKKLPVLTLDTRVRPIPGVSTRELFGADSLAILAQQTDLHVFGWGLDEEQRQALHNSPYHLHPPAEGSGITGIHWLSFLKSGDPLLIQGRFRNKGSRPATLLLQGLSARLDSCEIKAGSDTLFTLSTVPKLRGKGLYTISAVSAGKTLEEEPIPLQVDSSAAINVLLLSATPDFDNKFLKTWLSTHGYGVAVRTGISTDKYNQLFINREEPAITQLTPALLKGFDVLVSDPASLAKLSPAELEGVQRSISRNGLGLLIRADSLLPRSFYGAYFPLVQTGDSVQKAVPLVVNNLVSDTLSWQVEQPLFVRLQPGTQQLVTSTNQASVASSVLLGNGKVVLTTVNNSFNWLLKGDTRAYAAFWSGLIRKALPDKPATHSWQFSPLLPVAGKEVRVIAETDQAGTPDEQLSGNPIAYAQDLLLPFRWQAVYWPAQGWQTAGSGRDAQNWYVYKATDWQPLRTDRLLRSNRLYLASSGAASRPQKESAGGRKQIPPFLFFLLFVLAAAFLWIEKKVM